MIRQKITILYNFFFSKQHASVIYLNESLKHKLVFLFINNEFHLKCWQKLKIDDNEGCRKGRLKSKFKKNKKKDEKI